jgi:hypothetical protein
MGLYADHERGMVDIEAAKAHADAAGLSVDAENVLYVRKAILDEYEMLLTVLAGEGQDVIDMSRPYGADPVSKDAFIAFPQRVALLLSQCKDHVLELLAMADKLKEAAAAYGLTEDQIAATPANAAAVAEVNATIGSILKPWDRS